ncbi:MarR family winged helix-turn-helix transcriptional regulator [Arthrobacter sp. U41]|uniref:MarR family winged helix-turn-helix transcriptional regulator n=1 Tax=Arthrobacter sp. U41 TaxID=1849032 RepID=UPI0008596C69|nr:MarR family transcriptional regulator [Arthrobacter sp. U41]AOT04769.1 MarR family transcriptional regulator [Arthrobacter sp. U41]
MTRDIEPNLQGTYRLVMTAARLIRRRQDEALAPLNLTRAAVIALEAIAPRPLNQEQLAAKVHVQSQTLGRVIARLEAGGFVTRTRNPADRRELHVQLTSAGRAALATARQTEIDAFPSTMDVADWQVFQEQLERFVNAVRLPSPRPAPDGGATQRPVRQ